MLPSFISVYTTFPVIIYKEKKKKKKSNLPK